MRLKTCEIRECGAKVLVLSISGQPFAVNPKKVNLVVTDLEGAYRMVSGFQPHYYTCVNIGDRLSRQGSPGA